MNVKTTSLRGELEERIYMHQPQGFVSNGDEHKVCKFMSSTYDRCVYFERLEAGILVFAIVSHIMTTGK